ncbi:hypothetical protein [Prosthecochloris sp. ZM_2]|nr:hypothetical protein [Prosthecochloris sp. ZM_2]
MQPQHLQATSSRLSSLASRLSSLRRQALRPLVSFLPRRQA